MSVEANAAVYPVSRSANAGALFSAALILATILPFCGIALVPSYPLIAPVVAFALLLGSTHVAATFYLLTDGAIRRFLHDHPVRMVVVPCVLFTAGIAVFCNTENPVFVPALLLTSLWQTWHFGAQNIGVATFVSLTDRGRPLLRYEKIAIRAGVVVGMLGVLKAMAPIYMIGENYVPLGPTAVAVIGFCYHVGLLAAVPLTGLALWLAAGAWLKQQYLFAISIFLSVTFLFTMYVSRDYTLGFISFAAAHGLQYLIFLGAHSVSRGKEVVCRRRLPVLIVLAPAALLLFMAASRLIAVQPGGASTIGISVMLSVSLVHFWVDQFLWRMKDKDRAAWMKARFGFVFARHSSVSRRAVAS